MKNSLKRFLRIKSQTCLPHLVYMLLPFFLQANTEFYFPIWSVSVSSTWQIGIVTDIKILCMVTDPLGLGSITTSDMPFRYLCSCACSDGFRRFWFC
ncbi:hypothetical protein GDO78_012619 [Eleutherodactylus coqui]|uniref:Uncharacterized protein n=1 Tax=Eleutherodactylus coqui TaxID=57060 RepID=A0A8J6F1Z0_ELECQ|nr:hypothetical protein GDO78_012619 [Eleutherodactylus coqui]